MYEEEVAAYGDEEVLEEETEVVTVANEGYYETWDLDNDGLVEETEWEEGCNTYMTGYDYDADLYTEWDVDGDGNLEDEEFSTGMFGYWDSDDSGFIEETEYTTYYAL